MCFLAPTYLQHFGHLWYLSPQAKAVLHNLIIPPLRGSPERVDLCVLCLTACFRVFSEPTTLAAELLMSWICTEQRGELFGSNSAWYNFADYVNGIQMSGWNIITSDCCWRSLCHYECKCWRVLCAMQNLLLILPTFSALAGPVETVLCHGNCAVLT